MANRIFNLRQSADYSGDDNTVENLVVEVATQKGWEPLELDTGTAGFLLFCYTVLTCQHMYMRVNAAERDILLKSADGTLELVADNDWNIKNINVDFSASLRSGKPSAEDIDYITGRMKVCPVSKNLADISEKHSTLTFD